LIAVNDMYFVLFYHLFPSLRPFDINDINDVKGQPLKLNHKKNIPP